MKGLKEQMTKKYIVKNCPTLQQTYYCDTHHSKCQDCTDCLIKQVVEECKERTVGFIEEGLIKDNILKLFTIEEVE